MWDQSVLPLTIVASTITIEITLLCDLTQKLNHQLARRVGVAEHHLGNDRDVRTTRDWIKRCRNLDISELFDQAP